MTANNSSKISKKPLLTHQRSSSDFAIDYQAGLSTPLLQRNHTRGNTLDNSAIISQLDISHFDDNNPQPTAQATLSRSSNELNSLYATNPEEFGVNNPSLSSEPLFQSHDSPLFKMIASSTAEDYVHTSDIIVSPQQTTNQLALSNKSNKSSPKNSIIPQDINSTSLDISSAENPNDSLDTSVVQTDTNFKGKLTRSALFSAPLIGSCIAFNKTTNDPTSGLVSTVSTMTNLYLTQGLLRDSAVDSQTIMTHLKANTTFELSVNLASILGGLIKKPSPEHAATSLGLGLMMNIPNFIMEARYLKLARKKPSEIYHQNQSQDIDENMRSEVSFSSGNSTHGDATLERLVDGEDNIKNYKKIKNFGMKICGLLSTLLVVNNSIFPHNPVFNAILEGYLLNIAITTLSEKAKIFRSSQNHKTRYGRKIYNCCFGNCTWSSSCW